MLKAALKRSQMQTNNSLRMLKRLRQMPWTAFLHAQTAWIKLIKLHRAEIRWLRHLIVPWVKVKSSVRQDGCCSLSAFNSGMAKPPHFVFWRIVRLRCFNTLASHLSGVHALRTLQRIAPWLAVCNARIFNRFLTLQAWCVLFLDIHSLLVSWMRLRFYRRRDV